MAGEEPQPKAIAAVRARLRHRERSRSSSRSRSRSRSIRSQHPSSSGHGDADLHAPGLEPPPHPYADQTRNPPQFNNDRPPPTSHPTNQPRRRRGPRPPSAAPPAPPIPPQQKTFCFHCCKHGDEKYRQVEVVREYVNNEQFRNVVQCNEPGCKENPIKCSGEEKRCKLYPEYIIFLNEANKLINKQYERDKAAQSAPSTTTQSQGGTPPQTATIDSGRGRGRGQSFLAMSNEDYDRGREAVRREVLTWNTAADPDASYYQSSARTEPRPGAGWPQGSGVPSQYPPQGVGHQTSSGLEQQPPRHQVGYPQSQYSSHPHPPTGQYTAPSLQFQYGDATSQFRGDQQTIGTLQPLHSTVPARPPGPRPQFSGLPPPPPAPYQSTGPQRRHTEPRPQVAGYPQDIAPQAQYSTTPAQHTGSQPHATGQYPSTGLEALANVAAAAAPTPAPVPPPSHPPHAIGGSQTTHQERRPLPGAPTGQQQPGVISHQQQTTDNPAQAVSFTTGLGQMNIDEAEEEDNEPLPKHAGGRKKHRSGHTHQRSPKRGRHGGKSKS